MTVYRLVAMQLHTHTHIPTTTGIKSSHMQCTMAAIAGYIDESAPGVMHAPLPVVHFNPLQGTEVCATAPVRDKEHLNCLLTCLI